MARESYPSLISNYSNSLDIFMIDTGRMKVSLIVDSFKDNGVVLRSTHLLSY
jgi:hypothetical protein